MRYVHRGNYGLISEEEMAEAGMAPETARDMMALKLRLSFGEIRRTEEFVDCAIVGREPVEVRNGVMVRRLRLNVFEFSYGGDTATVDLNLAPDESYEAPYPLGYHQIDREYFSVVHSGDGDGWDPNRPAMASILMFQGEAYLVDAGLNLRHCLKALGIGVSEIQGIFQTHAHDEHFCGLTTLMRADHKVKYFATPWVRASVMKKLSELLSMDEEEFSQFFEIHDLADDVWNDVGSLEVRPVFSPHPVETTVLMFRAACEGGHRSYAHLGDIISLDVLRGLVGDGGDEPGVSQALYDKVQRDYLLRADLKKIDIGGRPIHGEAEDFKEDRSDRIVLSHTSDELTDQEKEIGSGAPFGSVDVLIPSHQDYVRARAAQYLHSYFPSVPDHQLETLLNNPVVDLNPETIIIRVGERSQSMYLVLAGDVEMIRSEVGLHRTLSAGSLVGEHQGLAGTPSKATYRAASFVRALRVPCRTYVDFVRRNDLHPSVERLRGRWEFLQETWLFGEAISYPVHNRIAAAMQEQSVDVGAELGLDTDAGIRLVKSGRLQIMVGDDVIETLAVGQFCGESTVLHDTPGISRVRAAEAAELYYVPGDVLAGIPAVRWKLFEVYERRMRMLMDPEVLSVSIFRWRDQYRMDIEKLDEQHMELLRMTEALHQAIVSGGDASSLGSALNALIRHTGSHFSDEEELMRGHGFPGYESHRQKHAALMEEVMEYERRLHAEQIELDRDFAALLQDWVVEHLLGEDQKYARFVKERGPG
jgi:hemerythrin